jgi:chlorite dismutase/nitrite reductase/ring-hydroxylating ferredoxin subunit
MADRSPRQVVKFSFYRVDPSWRALPGEERERHKREFCGAAESFAGRLQVRSYSAAGMRGDADFLLWQIGDRLEDIQELAAALLRTGLAPYLSMPHSYLAMTRRSVYLSAGEGVRRSVLRPADSRYLFVYPFVKTRRWYRLPLEERQAMMDEHIAIGRRYPSVKLNTTYSFGLDDQEFVVSFETDEPADFLDLVMELREAKSSTYTLRDTPVFTCVAMGLRETLDTLGGVETGAAQAPAAAPERWQRVAGLAEVPEGGGKVVHFRGQQVALFRAGERLYAIGNRCSHANGPLSDGVVEDGAVTCPYHASRFDLATGEPLGGPASRRVPVFDVRVEGGEVYLAARASDPT